MNNEVNNKNNQTVEYDGNKNKSNNMNKNKLNKIIIKTNAKQKIFRTQVSKTVD